ncbi:hypothetical protein JZ751_007038, partial [Albula glossodonta]
QLFPLTLPVSAQDGNAKLIRTGKTTHNFTSPLCVLLTGHQHPVINYTQVSQDTQGGKENFRTEILIQQPGGHSMVSPVQKTAAQKVSPNVLAPGYSRPLKEIPREKFNITVVPKFYCSPWREALGESEELLSTLNFQIPEPPQRQQPTVYRCFNRAPMPFGGPSASVRLLPVAEVDSLETHNEPVQIWNRVTKRPNFNRAPRGWGINYSPESNEL